MEAPKLYLIPNTLGPGDPLKVMPETVKQIILPLRNFVVENEKEARKFIKKIAPEIPQSELKLYPLHKHVDRNQITTYLDPICNAGLSMGLLSDAGVPGVADPGAEIVQLAHSKGVSVKPLVGPSSILMAMMSSGMNGQSFAFNGYLPIDKQERKKMLLKFEKRSKEEGQAQSFIETPYRNNKLIDDLIQILSPNTNLCIACDISLDSEYIKSKPVKLWKKEKPDIHKRPALFVFQA
ncbi:SAM-dependent methyltransferase [Flavobacteriaceae bacterium]|nr:SAM-dependent methyltransferase [Flavobacteriaceae bacterium]